MTGVSAPPLLYHFGHQFNKEAVRRILTRLFLVEALERVGTYSALGVKGLRAVLISLASFPLMFAGLYAGNRAFFRMPEAWFSRVAGAVIIAAAVKLLA